MSIPEWPGPLLPLPAWPSEPLPAKEVTRVRATLDALEKIDAFRGRCPQVRISIQHLDDRNRYHASEPGRWSQSYDDVLIMLADLQKRYPE